MGESRDNVDTFLEEFREQIIAGARSPGAIIEAWMSQQPTTITKALTQHEQMRDLLHVVEEGTSRSKADFSQIQLSQDEPKLIANLEQRQQTSRTTQDDEQNWTMEKTKQLENKQTKVNIKTKREDIKRHRQLACQVMEEIEQLWEETHRERNEIDFLKTKTEQQQEDIDRLTAEKHGQYLLIKRLRLQIGNVIEKLEENKSEATQEKMQLLKMRAEIYQERETLERRRNEIINERHKLEIFKYDKTKSQESNEPKELMEQINREQEIMEMLMADSLLCRMNKNKKIMLEAKYAKEQMEKNITDIKQELKRNKRDILQHRYQIEHIKHKMSVNNNKIKQTIQRYVQMQKATVPEMESRERQKEGKDTFDTVKIKLNRIQEEMEKLWDVLEVSEQQLEVTLSKKQELKTETGGMENMKSNSQKQRQDTNVSMKITQWEKEMQRQKQAIENKLAQVEYERDEIERIKTKIQTERENIERDRQLAEAEMHAMKCMRERTERQKRELDGKLQRTKKEMREMEVMSAEIEIKKKELVKMIRMSRRKKEEISKMKEEIEHAKQGDMEERQDKTEGQKSPQVLEVDMEDRFDEQQISKIRLQQVDRTREIIQHKENQFEDDNMETSTKNKVNTDMQRMILEVEEIRKMLRRVREDTEQIRRGYTEEKSQIKWMNFRAKKKRQELDQWLEKTMKERDELEIVKIKIQRQREEVEQKLEDTIQTMEEMKTNIENAAAEVNNTREEIIKAQRMMAESKEKVKKYMLNLTENGSMRRRRRQITQLDAI
ncbi:trichohyalin-like [Siniperca chuatsi]|uniref:trichohyalin-like n=1 Tax=Siniperca chuatsi TaxID=119488 RepID=UPI001CE098F6|nr:trichohyalin-like [Siniperca chuatsi]XP_044078793.1 trichohyalin-like [Siniperca chuatsi]